MKLRNKKTGEIVEFDSVGFRKGKSNGWNDFIPNADSLAALNDEWEDYKPAELLIKGEKARKVFQEWADLIGAERFRVNHLCKFGITIITSDDPISGPVIELPGYIGEDSEIYTKEELGGEEEE